MEQLVPVWRALKPLIPGLVASLRIMQEECADVEVLGYLR
jgi:hypothetical protein